MSFDAVAHNLANLALSLTAGLRADTSPSGINQRWFRKNAPHKIVFIGDSVSDPFAAGFSFYTQLATHQATGGALEGVTFTRFGSNGNTGSGWAGGGGATYPNPITNVTLAGGVASITYSTTGTAPNILYLLSPGDQVRIAGVNGITGLPALATVISNSGSASSYTATIAAPNATGTYSATGTPTISYTALLADLPTDADLYFLRYLINDVRTGACTLAQATQVVINDIDAIAARAPAGAQIVLLVPNTLTLDDYDTGSGAPHFVTSTGQWVGMTIAQAAQAASTMMRDAYYAAWVARPACALIDLQSEIYGRTCLNRLTLAGNPNAKPLMYDQLHPDTPARILEADYIASLLDVRTDRGPVSNRDRAFSLSTSTAAHAENFANPHLRYPQSVRDERYWTVTYMGKVGSSGATFANIGGTPPDYIPRGVYAVNFSPSDFMLVGGQAMRQISATNASGVLQLAPSGANWAAVNLATPAVGDPVYHCRSKSGRSVKARQLSFDPSFPWQRYGYIAAVAGDGSYIDVAAFPGAELASVWALTAADTCFVQAETQTVSLTGATIAANGNNLRITKTAAYFTTITGFGIAFLGAAR